MIGKNAMPGKDPTELCRNCRHERRFHLEGKGPCYNVRETMPLRNDRGEVESYLLHVDACGAFIEEEPEDPTI